MHGSSVRAPFGALLQLLYRSEPMPHSSVPRVSLQMSPGLRHKMERADRMR
jgi:hypothetical protein